MARSQSVVFDELLRLAPSWVRRFAIGRALLQGLARLLAWMESTYDEWHAELSRQTASGSMLDSHGEDAGTDRDPWEDDDELRPRAVSESRGPTPAFLEAEATRVAFPYADGYRLDFEEPKLTVADVDAFADCSVLYPLEQQAGEARYPIAVTLPVGEVPPTRGFFSDVDFSDIDFAHPLPWNLLRNQFQRPIAALMRRRPAGVGLRAEVLDPLQLATALALGDFDTSYHV